MNVKSISLFHVMGHDKFQLDLPDSGVVLVTGANGIGKSTIVEAAPIAVWGKTLRGTSPWHTKKTCEAVVNVNDLVVRRTRKSGRSAVKVEALDVPEFDTAAKAQDHLAHTFGTFDAWRRTHVFSSHDAAHFTLATDAERKRLLESLLELSKFDTALKACRADLKAKQAEVSTIETTALRLGDRAQMLDDETARLKEQTAELPDDDLPALRKLIRKHELCIEEWETDISDFRSRVHELELASAQDKAELRTKEAQLKRIDHNDCPTCGQNIPAALVQPLRDEVSGLRSKIHQQETAAATEANEFKTEQQKLAGELRGMRSELADAQKRIRDCEAAKRQREKIAERLESQLKRVSEALAQLDVAKASLANEQANLDEIEAAATVLGIRGVRSQVLGRTLSGLELVANAWLSRIDGPKLSIELKPYTEKKTGGASDAISLNVVGAGGGHGYRAASGGERRRIDVAILLALADIASASSQNLDARRRLGEGPATAGTWANGTLFFDEVFDTLDSDGLESVITIAHELAKDRAVVVISHSEELGSRLNPAVHVRL